MTAQEKMTRGNGQRSKKDPPSRSVRVGHPSDRGRARVAAGGRREILRRGAPQDDSARKNDEGEWAEEQERPTLEEREGGAPFRSRACESRGWRQKRGP